MSDKNLWLCVALPLFAAVCMLLGALLGVHIERARHYPVSVTIDSTTKQDRDVVLRCSNYMQDASKDVALICNMEQKGVLK